MTFKETETYTVRLYLSGPPSEAARVIRAECLRDGLCVTIEPTTFIYTGGEEAGYVIGLLNYPRFPSTPSQLWDRAIDLAHKLLEGTYQHSVLLVDPRKSVWISKRESA